VLNTPLKNSTWVQQRLSFIYDEPANYNQNASETFYRGGEDCEDIAMLVAYNLVNSGREAHVFDVQWGDVETDPRGHAVGLYSEGGAWWYINTGIQTKGQITGPFGSLEAAADSVNGSWVRYTLFDIGWGLEQRVYR
jgi:hypothetical protein